MSRKRLQRERVFELVTLASARATQHLAGIRDKTLPDRFDLQLAHFLDLLREMELSLRSGEEPFRSSGVISWAVTDGWPHDSELGNMLLKAESAYRLLTDS